MSWKPEVQVPSDNKWYDNAVRFETKDEALLYASDLRDRWTAVQQIRATEVDDKVNGSWIDGKMVWHDMVDGSLQLKEKP